MVTIAWLVDGKELLISSVELGVDDIDSPDGANEVWDDSAKLEEDEEAANTDE